MMGRGGGGVDGGGGCVLEIRCFDFSRARRMLVVDSVYPVSRCVVTCGRLEICLCCHLASTETFFFAGVFEQADISSAGAVDLESLPPLIRIQNYAKSTNIYDR